MAGSVRIDREGPLAWLVFDHEARLHYRGPIDDQYGINYRLAEPRVRYVDDERGDLSRIASLVTRMSAPLSFSLYRIRSIG